MRSATGVPTSTPVAANIPIAWATSSPCQKYFGRLADQTGSFNEGIALAGLTPLIGYVALILLWREPEGTRAKPAQVAR